MYKKNMKIGKRESKARKRMIKFFESTNEYYSAKKIHEKLKKYNIGIATIYRNLDLMENENILTSIKIDGVSKYRLFDSIHQHHLICDKCGRIIDIREDCVDNIKKMVEEFSKFLENKYEFNLTQHNLDFIGLCRECNPKKEERL
ncbi:MAG TPA: transcriptional repressor, partial [Candidatus Mcinerneyibacterium sp.]|nr:transcriptional repressor [Candidatus Mcinerneyibacterium sp.]